MNTLNLIDVEDTVLFLEELAVKEKTDFLLNDEENNEEEENASN